jgi:hypothetical protein
MIDKEIRTRTLQDALANPLIPLSIIAMRNGVHINTLKSWMKEDRVGRGYSGMSLGGKLTRKRAVLSRLLRQVQETISKIEFLEKAQQKAQ